MSQVQHQQNPPHLHLFQQSPQQHALLQQVQLQQQHADCYRQQPQHDSPDVYAQAMVISGLSHTASANPNQFRYNSYPTSQHIQQSQQQTADYSFDQVVNWPTTTRENIGGSTFMSDQPVISQNISYPDQAQNIRYNFSNSANPVDDQIWGSTQTKLPQTSFQQQMLSPSYYDYVNAKKEQSQLQNRAASTSPYTALQQSADQHTPVTQYQQQKMLNDPRYGFSKMSQNSLAEMAATPNYQSHLTADALNNPVAVALGMGSRSAGATPNIHPSKVNAKPQQQPRLQRSNGDDMSVLQGQSGATSLMLDSTNSPVERALSGYVQSLSLETSPMAPENSLNYAMQMSRTVSGIDGLAVSPTLASCSYHLGNTGIAVMQEFPEHGHMQVHRGSQEPVNKSTLSSGGANSQTYTDTPTPTDGRSTMASDEDDCQWKIPRGVTNIAQIIEQWERGDGPNCPALCNWTVGMRRRERSIFSQRKKLYEEYIRLGSVEGFNSKYKDLPIGKVYAIVSSRNRKARRENNLISLAQSLPWIAKARSGDSTYE